MPSIAERRATFRRMHESGCFALPNPWDIGTARYLQHMGFQAIATTSAGAAWTQGRPDNKMPLNMMVAHIRELVEATDVPVNADFENGYAHEPEKLAENVKLCAATGVSALSVEDSTGDKAKPLYDIDVGVVRIKAARAALDASAPGTMLVGRAECFLVGLTDINEVIRRLKAYGDAGADVLYAPGLRTREHIEAVVKAVAPKPFNLLIGGAIGLTMADAAATGVRRVSVGGALARAAWGGFIRAAKGLKDGNFDGFKDATPHPELQSFFRDDLLARENSAKRGA